MKLQFDPNQTFQLDAVAAVAALFDGQPQGAPEYAVINLGDTGASGRRDVGYLLYLFDQGLRPAGVAVARAAAAVPPYADGAGTRTSVIGDVGHFFHLFEEHGERAGRDGT